MRRTVLSVFAASMLLAGCGGDEEPDALVSPAVTTVTASPTTTPTGGLVSSPTVLGTPEGTCDAVERFPEEGRDHVAEGEDVQYNSDPPTSGPHYATPAQPGFYTDPLPDEQLVHNLEHGQIVIWYSAGAPLDVVEQLSEVVSQAAEATVAAPRALPDADAVVLTAWTALQRCVGVNPGAITGFRIQFQGQGPEPITPRFQP